MLWVDHIFRSEKEKGNALFLILIALALFAALAYAITQSGRSGGSGVTAENGQLLAARIIQYAGDVQQAVMRLKLRGCTDAQISFQGAPLPGYIDQHSFDNPNSPGPDKSCWVFDSAGGGVVGLDMGGEYLFQFGTGPDSLQGIGTSLPDLYMTVDINPAQKTAFAICAALNRAEGVTSAFANGVWTSPYNDGFNLVAYSPYQGSFSDPGTPYPTPAEMVGKKSLCWGHNGGGIVSFYYVLIER